MRFCGISAFLLSLASAASATSGGMRGFANDVVHPITARKLDGTETCALDICGDYDDIDACNPTCDHADMHCKPGDALKCIYHEHWEEDERQVIIQSNRAGSGIDGKNSYWKVDFHPDDSISNFVPAWCVDVGRGLSGSDGARSADIYSTYSPNIPDHPSNAWQRAVDKIKFLPAINYILNAEDLQQGWEVPHCEATIQWSDIQKAIWNLIDDNTNSFSGLSTTNQCVYDHIVYRASTKFNYEPGCGGKLAVLLVIDDDLDNIHKQVIVAVVDAAPCKECPDECIDHASHREENHKVYIKQDRSGQPGSSYWRVDLFPDDGDGIQAFSETWCVDLDTEGYADDWYYADIYSSYDIGFIPAGAVEEYQNLDAVNYLLNSPKLEQGQTIDACPGSPPIGWKEVQAAIWLMVETGLTSLGAPSGYNVCVAEKMRDIALAEGDGYEPTCQDQLLVLLVIPGKQVIGSLVPPNCGPCNECDPLDYYAPVPLDRSNGFEEGEECYSITATMNPNPYGDCKEGLYCIGQWGGIWGTAKCFPIGYEDQEYYKPYGYTEPEDPLAAITLYVPVDYWQYFSQYPDYDCPEAMNLGPQFMGNLSAQDYDVIKVHASPFGYSTGISLLVGGDLYSIIGAEIEGKIIVLGNLNIEQEGARTLVQTGAGSGVVPPLDDDYVMMVCEWVHMNIVARWWGDDVTRVIGGNAAIGQGVDGPGKLIAEPEWDSSTQIIEWADLATQKLEYMQLISDIATKSQYWATLEPNGKVLSALYSTGKNVVTFTAGDEGCLQVFHLSEADFGHGSYVVDIKFDPSLEGKTILFNVASKLVGVERHVVINKLGNFEDTKGANGHSFDPVLKASILWNCYDADLVVMGDDTSGGPEWPGSFIVPNGNLVLNWSGLSGRLVVGGDLYLANTGLELHNYDFIPPCPLPPPPCFECPSPPPPPGCPCDEFYDCPVEIVS